MGVGYGRMKLAYTPHAVAHDNTRDIERSVLGRRGVLRMDGVLQPVDVVVLDLTRDGCGIQGNVSVKPGMHIEIGIANVGRVPATVLWRVADSFGCMFDRPLPPGSVTAASGPRNVLPFPSDTTAEHLIRPAGKLKPRSRMVAILGTMVLCWGAIGALFFTVL